MNERIDNFNNQTIGPPVDLDSVRRRRIIESRECDAYFICEIWSDGETVVHDSGMWSQNGKLWAMKNLRKIVPEKMQEIVDDVEAEELANAD